MQTNNNPYYIANLCLHFNHLIAKGAGYLHGLENIDVYVKTTGLEV